MQVALRHQYRHGVASISAVEQAALPESYACQMCKGIYWIGRTLLGMEHKSACIFNFVCLPNSLKAE